MRILKPNTAGSQEIAGKLQSKVQKTDRFSKVLDKKRKESLPESTRFAEGQEQRAASADASQTDNISSAPAALNIEQLANEIVDHISCNQTANARTVEIQFNSQTLHGLRVGVQSQGGEISVDLLTSVTGVAELLNNNLGNLRSALEIRGIRVAHLRVSRRAP